MFIDERGDPTFAVEIEMILSGRRRFENVLRLFLTLSLSLQLLAPIVAYTDLTAESVIDDSAPTASAAIPDAPDAAATTQPPRRPAELVWQTAFRANELAPGATARLSLGFANVGDAPLTSHSVEIELAAALTIQATGAKTDSFALPRLAGGASHHVSVAIQAPETAGEYGVRLRLRDNANQRVQSRYLRLIVVDREAQDGNRIRSTSEDQGWQFVPNPPQTALFTGAMNYSYPIEVPPARGGIGPQLALAYGSRTVDAKSDWYDSNPYGEGWSLGGLPVIRRIGIARCDAPNDEDICASNDSKDFEDKGDQVNSFMLYMNGDTHHLIPAQDTAGACYTNSGPGCVRYVAENAPHLFVEYHSNENTHNLSQYWVVRDLNGIAYTFGRTLSGQLQHQDAKQMLVKTHPDDTNRIGVASWWLDEQVDAFGNKMTISYKSATTDPGYDGIFHEPSIRPSSIQYNFVGGTAHSEVVFGWTEDDRGDDDEPDSIFYTTHFIDDITIKHRVDGVMTPQWRYEMAVGDPYNGTADGDHERRLLESITHQRLDSQGAVEESWPATTFDYDDDISGHANGSGQHWVGITQDINGAAEDIYAHHLVRVHEGTGATYEFRYDPNDFKRPNGPGTEPALQNWDVERLYVYDGVEHVHGVSITPTYWVSYTNWERCYDEPSDHSGDKSCSSKAIPGSHSYALVGYGMVEVQTFDGDDQLLRAERHYFEDDESNDHFLAYGRPRSVTEYSTNDEDFTNVHELRRTTYAWQVMTPDDWEDPFHATDRVCPLIGIPNESGIDTENHYDAICLQEQATYTWVYDSGAADSNLAAVTVKQFEYDPQYQRETGVTSPADTQLGLRTNTKTLVGPNAGSLTQTHYEPQRYLVNTDSTQPIDWVAVPWLTDAVYAGASSDMVRATLNLYGSLSEADNLDPNGNRLTRGEQLSLSRQIVDGRAGVTGPAVDLVTRDILYGRAASHNAYGRVTHTYTYDTFGEQTADRSTPYDWAAIDSDQFAWYSATVTAATVTEYAPGGLVVSATIDAAGQVTTYTHGTTSGAFPWSLTASKDPADRESAYHFDTLGRLAQVLGPETSEVQDPSLDITYTLGGGIVITRTTFPAEDDTLRSETVTVQDGLGRVIERRTTGVTDETGGSPVTVDVVVLTAYDGLGRAVCVTDPFTITAGAAVTDGCTDHPHTTTTYDVAGRVVETVVSSGVTTTLSYAHDSLAGWLDLPGEAAGVRQVRTTVSDSAGTRSERVETYDTAGQVVWAAELDDQGDASTSNDAWIITRYGYDTLDRLVTVRRGELLTTTLSSHPVVTTTISYNDLGQKTALDDPDMGVWEYDYDGRGSLTRQVADPGGSDEQATCTSYDVLGRVTGQWVDGGTSCQAADKQDPQSTTSYYGSGPGLGQPSLIVYTTESALAAGAFSDAYSYDTLGRVETVTRTVDGEVFVETVLAYDRLSRPLTMTNAAGETITMTYDSWGGQALWVDGVQLVEGVEYDARGRRLSIERGNGVDSAYSYLDATGGYRLDLVEVKEGTDRRLLFDYTYDALGYISELNTAFYLSGGPQADIQQYGYDSLGRLMTAQTISTTTNLAGYDYAYGYDRFGNLEWVKDDDAAYLDYTSGREVGGAWEVPHQVLSTQVAGGSAYDYLYDALGRMTEREAPEGTYTQAFDAHGRLIEVEIGGDTTTFVYDPAGIRVLTIEPNGRRIYTPFPGFTVEIAEAALDLYVDDDAGSGNGTMANPYPTLGEAMARIISSGALTATVHLKQGTYPEAAVLGDNVTLLGSYAQSGGWLDTSRNPILYRTVLTGTMVHPDDTGGPLATLWVSGDDVLVNGVHLDHGDALADSGVVISGTNALIQSFSITGYGTALRMSQDGTLDHLLLEANDDGVLITAGTVTLRKLTVVDNDGEGVRAEAGTVTVKDGIYVNNSVPIHNVGTATVSSSYNLTWGNTNPHSGTISIDNLLQADPLFVDPWSADYRVFDSSPAKNSASDGGHRGAAGVLVPDTDPKVTTTVEIYTGATISPTVCAVAVDTDTETTTVLDVDGDEVNDCVTVSYGVSTTLAMPDTGQAWFEGYGIRAQLPTDSPAYEGPDDEGGIWGFWCFEDAVGGHFFIHAWQHWVAGTRQTIAEPGTASNLCKNFPNAPQGSGLGYYATGSDPELVARLAAAGLRERDGLQSQPGVYMARVITRTTYSLGDIAVALRLDSLSGEDDGLYYLHGDHLGSLSAMSYAEGANQGDLVADSLGRYLPFGGLRQDSGDQPLDGGGLSDRGFTGHYENRDLGLTYMQARFYDPLLRRFISADTIIPEPGRSMGYNRYAYVSQNPLNLVDPTGHCGADTAENGVAPDPDKLVECESLVEELQNYYGITIEYTDDWTTWLTLASVQAVASSLEMLSTRMGLGVLLVEIEGLTFKRGHADAAAQYDESENIIHLHRRFWFDGTSQETSIWTILHEIGHRVDFNRDWGPGLGSAVGIGQHRCSQFLWFTWNCGLRDFDVSPVEGRAAQDAYLSESRERFAQAFAYAFFSGDIRRVDRVYRPYPGASLRERVERYVWSWLPSPVLGPELPPHGYAP